jgi:N-acetylglutamate synthase
MSANDLRPLAAAPDAPLAIERAALRAWPSLEQHEDAGWLLRFAGGYTKRANSATPLVADTRNLAGRVERVERRYAARGLPPIFRLLSFAAPPGLDALLAARGYLRVDESLVLAGDAAALGAAAASALAAASRDDWLPCYERWSGADPARRELHRAILAAIEPPCLYALREKDGRPIACGLGVCDGTLVGLFDLAVAPEARRQGHGTALVRAICAWGQAQGAARAYLQVVEHNQAAHRLYGALGFREAYRYWYRVPPAHGQ